MKKMILLYGSENILMTAFMILTRLKMHFFTMQAVDCHGLEMKSMVIIVVFFPLTGVSHGLPTRLLYTHTFTCPMYLEIDSPILPCPDITHGFTSREFNHKLDLNQ